MSEHPTIKGPDDAYLRIMGALGSGLREIGWLSAKGIIYLTVAATIVHIAGTETINQLALSGSVITLINGLANSPVVQRLVASLGGNLLANIITELANRKSVSNQQILELIEDRFSASTISTDEIKAAVQKVIEGENLLKEKDFFRTIARQQRDQQEHLVILRNIETQVTQRTPESSSLLLLANQFDHLAMLVSDDTEKRLVDMREFWRKGERSRTQNQLDALMNDEVRWEALTRETKARILCLKGSVMLTLENDVDAARQFADQAHELAALSDEFRLRALIAYNERNFAKALELLESWEDADSIHLRAALYLEIQDTESAWQELNSDVVNSEPTAETFRLRALYYLLTKEIKLAQLEIEKAIELRPNWESVRFTQALIGYYGALSLEAFATPLNISIDPVDRIFVKQDDESTVRLRQAADTFQELASLPDGLPSEKVRFLSLTLACLSNDLAKQDDAEKFCQGLLDEDPSFPIAISWALARNYHINLEASESALRSLMASKAATVDHVNALIMCLIANKKNEEAIEVLEETRTVFEEQQVEAAWLLVFAQVKVLEGSPEEALVGLQKYEEGTGVHGAHILVLEALARKTGEWKQLYDYLEKVYAETNNPNFLLSNCEFRAQQQDWDFIVKHAETLLELFSTAKVLRLVVISSFNAERYSKSLELLDDHRHLFPKSRLPNDLRHMRVLCQHEMGILPEAINEARDLVSDDPSTENLLMLANLYVSKGDFKGLAVVSRQLSEMPDLPIEQALQLARFLNWEDRQLAISLWEKASSNTLPEELVGEAFFLGNQLGVAPELLQPIAKRLFELGREGRGGIKIGAARELVDSIAQGKEEVARVRESYLSGQVPIHLAMPRLGTPLALLYHHQLQSNERSPDPTRQAVLLARHGGRLPMEGFPDSISKLNLHLDISSILLAHHLGILPIVESAFAPLYIPTEVIPALIQMRGQITPHQPLRLEEYRQILELVQDDMIQIYDQDPAKDFDDETLASEMGEDWVAMLESARTENGCIVDHVPLTQKDLSGNPPTLLPEDIEQLLVNCRAIIESLQQFGPLSDAEYRQAIQALGAEGQVDPTEAIPSPGSELFFAGAGLEILAGTNLLFTICEHFRVQIGRQTYQRITDEITGSQQMQSLSDWIDRLISRLTTGIDNGQYKFSVISDETKKNIGGIRLENPVEGCLGTLLGFEISEGDLIWTDDRWLNSYRHRDGVPFADIIDILKLLVGSGKMSDEEYYQLLYRLRSANAIFIPVQRDEIVYQLRQAQIDELTGRVIETRQLQVLRKYIAACLLRENVIQVPPMPSGAPNSQGERAFVISLMQSTVLALFDIWAYDEYEESTKRALCEWILENIYVDHGVLLRSTSFAVDEDDQAYQASLGILMLLTPASFSAPLNDLGEEVSHRKAYLSWLFDRVLQIRFTADPNLVISTAEMLKQIFQNLRREVDQDELRTMAIDLLLQSFYDDLPKPIQDELRRDDEFMSSFGYIEAISVGDLSFELEEFLRGAQGAVNGNTSTIVTFDDQKIVVFNPAEEENSLQYIHPDSSEAVVIRDERFAILLDSAAERENALRRNKSWFDCPEHKLEEAVATIATTENLSRRYQIAEEWRQSSIEIYYNNLLNQIREQKSVSFPYLLPPGADRLLDHYRVQPSDDSSTPLSEVITTAAATLIQEEGLETVIRRLAGFPVPLPTYVLDTIATHTDEELETLVRDLLKVNGSPVSRMHLIRILSHLGDRRASYFRLARRIIRGQFTEDSVEEFEAFTSILNWVNSEMGFWHETDPWSPQIRLAMVWAHAHQIFCILITAGVPKGWIIETFSSAARRVPRELFNRDPTYWLDVSHPGQIVWINFMLMGTAYGIGLNSDKVVDSSINDLLTMITFREEKGVIVPALALLRDIERSPDSLESFLGGSYAERLAIFFGKERTRSFASSAFSGYAAQAVEEIEQVPDALGASVTLAAAVSDLPPYNSLSDRISRIIRQADFVGFLEAGLVFGLSMLRFAAAQSIYVSDKAFHQHLINEILRVVEYLAQFGQERLDLQDEAINSDQICISLVDIALDIAWSSGSTNAAVSEFQELITGISDLWPETVPILKPIVQAMSEGLPIQHGQLLCPLYLKLRTT